MRKNLGFQDLSITGHAACRHSKERVKNGFQHTSFGLESNPRESTISQRLALISCRSYDVLFIYGCLIHIYRVFQIIVNIEYV